MLLKELFWVGLGGGIGTMLRYLVSRLLVTQTTGSFPWATLAVNLVGCLIIGILLGLFDRLEGIGSHWRLLAVVGLCGGFTTFSAFSNDAIALLREGALISFIAYLSLSVVGGMLLTYIGLQAVLKS